MLPQAKTAVVGAHVRFERPPRNVCEVTTGLTRSVLNQAFAWMTGLIHLW